jgi:hypothetical protein
MNEPPKIVADFAECLRGLRVASRPETRFAEHLLYRDLNDAWHFAFHNPNAVRVCNEPV